jgi:hypothetical protein
MQVINLRKLKFSPDVNPLVTPGVIPVRSKSVRSGISTKALVDADSGEYVAQSVIHQVEKVDERQFVKVFLEGVKAAYSLNKTAFRVFQLVLEEYEKSPLRGGYAETVTLAWFDGGLCGRSLDMSETTFHRGLKELLAKNFLSPQIPNIYWVNPALFFKGDAVAFVKTYQKAKAPPPASDFRLEQTD